MDIYLKIVAYQKSHRKLEQYQCPALITVCQKTKITKVRIITTFRSITKAWVDVFSSRFYKRKNASFHKLFYCHLGSFPAVSAVNYQTVCNDLYLGSVQTSNCFYRSHNPADIRNSQLVTRLLTENCNFCSLYDTEF